MNFKITVTISYVSTVWHGLTYVCSCSFPQTIYKLILSKPSWFVIPVATLADLFAEGDKPKKSVKSKKKTKKSSTGTTKDLSMFDDNAPSIFDDPLSAMGASSHS